MAGFRPFVYVSEAIIATNNPVHLLQRILVTENCYRYPELKSISSATSLLKDIWVQEAFSVKSQASLYRSESSQYKPQQYRIWLESLIDQLLTALNVNVREVRAAVRSELLQELIKPQNYSIPAKARLFLRELDSNNIPWGVLANESYLYPTILKHLNIRPFVTVMADRNSFKPLPSIVRRAIDKVPRNCRNNVWFVGSDSKPCDNIASEHMKCVLLGSRNLVSDRRLRIRELDDLKKHIFLKPSIDWDTLSRDEDSSAGDVILKETRANSKNLLLPLGRKERGLSNDTTSKKKVS